jgi:hypothetical protein
MATSLMRRDFLLRPLQNATPGTTDPVLDTFGRTVVNTDHLGRANVGQAWATGTAYSVGDIRTLVASGAIVQVTVAGTSHASTPPTAPAHGATVTDNTVTWRRIH